MPSRKIDAAGKFSINSGCRWCGGTGFISVPDYSQIGELKLYDRIMSMGWVFAPTIAAYCHECFCEGTPVIGETSRQHLTLMDHIDKIKKSGIGDMDLLKSCLRWQLKARHHTNAVEQLMDNAGLGETPHKYVNDEELDYGNSEDD